MLDMCAGGVIVRSVEGDCWLVACNMSGAMVVAAASSGLELTSVGGEGWAGGSAEVADALAGVVGALAGVPGALSGDGLDGTLPGVGAGTGTLAADDGRMASAIVGGPLAGTVDSPHTGIGKTSIDPGVSSSA